MGGRLCCPHHHGYSVRKKQNKAGLGTKGKISSVTPACEKFDSIKSDSAQQLDSVHSKSGSQEQNTTVKEKIVPCSMAPASIASDVSTFNGSVVSPAVAIQDTSRLSQFSQVSEIPGFGDHDCDTISNISSHSDLGSDCASTCDATQKSDSDPKGAESLTLQATYSEDTVTPLRGTDSIEQEYLARHAPQRHYTYSRLGTRHKDGNLDKKKLLQVYIQPLEEVIQWKKGNKLGSGTFGNVFLGLTNTGGLIAVKEIRLTSDLVEAEKEYDKIYKEVSILKELNHQNIVSYLGASYEDNIISIFMQYVPGGSLYSIIQKFGPLEETITICYTQQLLDAVSYLHENNVVHRDIKSANIMLMPEGLIKLIDFGCATRLCIRLSQSGSHLQKSIRGTPYWMAPEVINESGHGKKSDIWSLGCTVFEMLMGKPPWGDREPLAAIFAIGSDDIPLPTLPDSFSPQAREFVCLSLLRDKYKRPEACTLKTHPFLTRPLPPRSPRVNAAQFVNSEQKKPQRKDTY